MTAVAIIASCVIGAFMAIVQLSLFGASFGDAALTYFGTAMTLSTLSVVAIALRQTPQHGAARTEDLMAEWQDWHEEEDWRDAEREAAMEAEVYKDIKRKA